MEFFFGQILAEEQRSLILGHKVPLLLAYRTADLAHAVNGKIDEQSVKLVGIVGVFLVTHKQDAVNAFFLCLGIREVLTCADSLQTALISTDKRLDTFKDIGIKFLLPSLLGGKGEKLGCLGWLALCLGCVLLEHLRVIRQFLQIGADTLPIGRAEVFLELLVKGRLVPRTALLRAFKNGLVFQKTASLYLLFTEIFRQIGLDTAFCGVDLKSRKYGKRFCFLSAFLLGLGVDVLVVSDDTAVKCRIGNLTDARGKGIADRLKTSVPIAGVVYQRIGRGYLQKRERHLIADGIVCTCIVLHHAIVQYRLGYGLYHIAVVVRTAKAFCDKRRGRYHYYVGQMR